MTINGSCWKTESHRWRESITKFLHLLTKLQNEIQVFFVLYENYLTISFCTPTGFKNLYSVLDLDFSTTNDSLPVDSGSCLTTSSSSALASTNLASGLSSESEYDQLCDVIDWDQLSCLGDDESDVASPSLSIPFIDWEAKEEERFVDGTSSKIRAEKNLKRPCISEDSDIENAH